MKHKVPIILIICLCLGSAGNGLSQNDIWMVHFQVTSNFGFPERNVGFRVIGEYRTEESMEFSVSYGVKYHGRNFGPDFNHLEHLLLGSMHFVWGERLKDAEDDLSYIKFLDSRTFKNSIGYSWQRYFNNIGTSQNVGTIHMRFNKTITQFSNDVFANTNGKDRYRTGGVAFGFFENKTMYLSRLLIWTGDSHCEEVQKIRDTDYPARWGYRDISKCNYGNLSHGILSFTITHDIGYGQTIGAQVGVDSERIRHFVQNKVFHDLYFVPRFMNNTKNLHLPMKAKNGENYLFKEGQEIRDNRLVWQLSLNPSSLY